MSFVQDTGVDVVELLNTGVVDIGNDTIDEELEVLNTSLPSMQIVEGGDTVEIVNILPNRLQYPLGFQITQRGNLRARFTNITVNMPKYAF